MHSTTMTPANLAAYIDHTLLKPEATSLDIERLCQEAFAHSFKAVCVNPIHVALTRKILEGSKVLTASVIGFPLGAALSSIKALESEQAVRNGAAEIDMVVRIDLIKQAKWSEAEADIAAVVQAVPGTVVKVILESGMLTREELIAACKLSEAAGAAFVKTATGFLGRGATVEDVEVMRQTCSDHVQIKASGGVKTFEQAVAVIRAGANRIGTSSGVALVTGAIAGSGY